MLKKIIYFMLSLLLVGSTPFSAFAHDDISTLLEDVNKDGIVNIQDLVLVATAFGKPGNRNALQNPDVNRDGTVNVLDLVRVSNNFGKTEVNDNSTYHEIQDYIFDKSCANSACHAAPANAGSLNLTYGLSYQELVGRIPQNPAAAAAGMKLIDPGNPENSFLLTKLIDPTPEQGVRMPFNAGTLHTGKIDAIRSWIAAGAPQAEILDGIGDLSVLRDPLEVFEPPEPPREGYQLRMPPFKIEPGTEREVFYHTQITDENGQPVDGDVFVNGIEVFYPIGSHHFALFYLTDAAVSRGLLDIGVVPEAGVAPSKNFRVFELAHIGLLGLVGTERIFIMGTQRDETSFRFPEGVALRLPGDTVYDLNSHYINLLGTETMQGEVYVNIHTIPPETVKYEAKVLLVYNNDIDVPPGTTRTTGYDWLIKDELERLDAPSNANMHVVLLNSHMHRHGELFEITRLSTSELLYRSVAYNSAPISVFDPPLILNADDGLKFACTQSNYDKDGPIRFGFTSEDEMCVMYGYYYLSTEHPETVSE